MPRPFPCSQPMFLFLHVPSVHSSIFYTGQKNERICGAHSFLMYISPSRKSASKTVCIDHYTSLATTGNSSFLFHPSNSSSDVHWYHENPELTLSTMSGFLSPEAEAALMGETQETRRIFYQNQAQNARMAQRSSRSSYQQQYTSAPATMTGYAQVSQSYASPAQYVSSWPATSPSGYGRSGYSGSPYGSSLTPIVPSSPYLPDPQYSNAPWPALHPDDIERSSDGSRSVSPNPADLHNFGYLLPDGRSWRCAHSHCTSQAVFTRGCDLRKHFKRHTKSLYCQYEDCPQSREGGFSSKKDKDRHESRHAPKIHCTQSDCERVFSRVDNMKDHVRRIHRKDA